MRRYERAAKWIIYYEGEDVIGLRLEERKVVLGGPRRFVGLLEKIAKGMKLDVRDAEVTEDGHRVRMRWKWDVGVEMNREEIRAWLVEEGFDVLDVTRFRRLMS